MIKLVCFIHRRPEMSRESFLHHWQKNHGPLIEAIPELRRLIIRYEQNHRLESDYSRDAGTSRDEADGATIMWFESIREYKAFAAHPLYAEKIAPDELHFMDRTRTLYFFTHEAEKKIGDATTKASAKVKLLALLKRKYELSSQDFHSHWSGPHGDLFRETPALRDQILAYDQNHRPEQDYLRDPSTPWDGLAEQWYASLDAFYAGAGGGPFEEIVVPDEERFMDRESTRFILCEPPHLVFGSD
jgi:uncharacterized protein (TIGR02118 family)